MELERGSPPFQCSQECRAWSLSAYHPQMQNCTMVEWEPWESAWSHHGEGQRSPDKSPERQANISKDAQGRQRSLPFSMWEEKSLYGWIWIKGEGVEGWRGWEWQLCQLFILVIVCKSQATWLSEAVMETVSWQMTSWHKDNVGGKEVRETKLPVMWAA